MIAARVVAQRRARQAAEAGTAVPLASDDGAPSVSSGASRDASRVRWEGEPLFFDKLMESRRLADVEPPEEALAAAGSFGRPVPTIGTCAICGQAMAARRQIKTLPCGHIFHFACIDGFHRQKLRQDKDVGLPCYTCGTPTNQSIASVAEEVRKRREAEMAKVKAELAAGAGSLALEDEPRHGSTAAVGRPPLPSQGRRSSSSGPSLGSRGGAAAAAAAALLAPPMRQSSREELLPAGGGLAKPPMAPLRRAPGRESPEVVPPHVPRRAPSWDVGEQLHRAQSSTPEIVVTPAAAARRSWSQGPAPSRPRRSGGALAALARASREDDDGGM